MKLQNNRSSRNRIVALAFLITAISFGQKKTIVGEAKINDDEVKIENMSIHVTVDSEEDLKSTFTIDDINNILSRTREDEDISFKITCNNKEKPKNIESNVTLTVKGNSNNKTKFLKDIEVIREKAINYYKTKK